jgi:hypothetical protein
MDRHRAAALANFLDSVRREQMDDGNELFCLTPEDKISFGDAEAIIKALQRVATSGEVTPTPQKIPKEVEDRAAAWFRAMSRAHTGHEWDWDQAGEEIRNIHRIRALLDDHWNSSDKSLVGMLTRFSQEDHSDLPSYINGEWSMRNLEALISDLMHREEIYFRKLQDAKLT